MVYNITLETDYGLRDSVMTCAWYNKSVFAKLLGFKDQLAQTRICRTLLLWKIFGEKGPAGTATFGER